MTRTCDLRGHRCGPQGGLHRTLTIKLEFGEEYVADFEKFYETLFPTDARVPIEIIAIAIMEKVCPTCTKNDEGKIVNASYPDGLGPYDEVRGHHLHAKSGFLGSPNYDVNKALAISQRILDQYRIDHARISAIQRQLFAEFARSGRPNTLAEHTRINYLALVKAGFPIQLANSLIMYSHNSLLQRMVVPTRIPWVVINPKR